MGAEKELVKVKNLEKVFKTGGTIGKKNYVHAVSDVSFEIYEGETLAVVGESGCGKSTLGRLILGLEEPTAGQVFIEGKNLMECPKGEMKAMRRQMQIIFQDPYASLNPRMTVFRIIAEPLITHYKYQDKNELRQEVIRLMNEVGIPEEYADHYPHQFSGGQRQRIGIARALALKPKLIVCDEPVSALDVSVQSQILNLLKEVQNTYGLTYLFISHDLSVVRFISKRVCVMFLGKICEIAGTKELYEKPLHPYTRFLLDAIPRENPRERNREINLLQGEIPSPIHPPSGCRFHTRCPYAKEICRQTEPQLTKKNNRYVACHMEL